MSRYVRKRVWPRLTQALFQTVKTRYVATQVQQRLLSALQEPSPLEALADEAHVEEGAWQRGSWI
jgi:hypothetical protein